MTAVRPATGAADGLVSEVLNGDVIQAFLDPFAARVRPGVHAVLVWDGAGYRSACSRQVPGERDAGHAAD